MYIMLILYNKVDTNSVAQLVSYLISIIPITHKIIKTDIFVMTYKLLRLYRDVIPLNWLLNITLLYLSMLQGASIILFFCIKVIKTCYDSLKTYIVNRIDSLTSIRTIFIFRTAIFCHSKNVYFSVWNIWSVAR